MVVGTTPPSSGALTDIGVKMEVSIRSRWVVSSGEVMETKTARVTKPLEVLYAPH